MRGAILGPVEPSGSLDCDAKGKSQLNLQELAAAAAGLSAESGSSDSCGGCIGPPRSRSTVGQTPAGANGATAAAEAHRLNAALPGREREPPLPLPSSEHQHRAPAQSQRNSNSTGDNDGAPRAVNATKRTATNRSSMDNREELQRGSLPDAATDAAAAAAAAAAATAANGSKSQTHIHSLTAPSPQQMYTMVAHSGVICGLDSADKDAAVPNNPGACGGGGGLGVIAPGQVIKSAAPAVAPDPAAVAFGSVGRFQFVVGPGRRPRKRSASTDADESSPLERGAPRGGEGPPPGYDLSSRGASAADGFDIGCFAAGSLPPPLLPPQQQRHHAHDHSTGGAARGVRAPPAASSRRGGGAATAAAGADGYDTPFGDADDGQDFPGSNSGRGATAGVFFGDLPPPVEVTVAQRVGGGRGGAEEDVRYGNGSYIRGSACGVFEPALYVNRMDCIRYQGTLISRSHFEKIGGSNMAKWYRSIRVLPDLEPLGEWLERHGMPVTKGPARRYRPRKHPGGSGGGGVGGGCGGGNDGGGDASGGTGAAAEVEAAAPPQPPPLSAKRVGSGEVCSSSCGGGGGADGQLQRRQSQQRNHPNGATRGSAALPQHQQFMTSEEPQGLKAAAAAAAAAHAAGESFCGGQEFKLEGSGGCGGGGGGGQAAELPPPSAAAAVAGPASEDEAEGTAALISLSMQNVNGPTASRIPLVGGGGSGGSGARDQSPQLQMQRRQHQQQAGGQLQKRQPQPLQPPNRQGGVLPYQVNGGGGVAAMYGGYDVEGLDVASDAERGGGGGGSAGDGRRPNGVSRGGAAARRGIVGLEANGEGADGRMPPAAAAALGARNFVTAAAAAAEAATAATAAATEVFTGPAAATRRDAFVGEAADRGGLGNPRFVQTGECGSETDDRRSGEGYVNIAAAMRTRQRTGTATRGMGSDGALVAAAAGTAAAGKVGAVRLHGSEPEDALRLPPGQLRYAAEEETAVARGGLRSVPLPPPRPPLPYTVGGAGKDAREAAATGGRVGAGSAWQVGADEYGATEEAGHKEDEQLQAHLASVGAPALLLAIQVEQLELQERLRQLDRLRRQIEALHQQQQQQQQRQQLQQRGGGDGYPGVLKLEAGGVWRGPPYDVAGRDGGVKRPHGGGGEEVVPGVGVGVGLQMMEYNTYGSGGGDSSGGGGGAQGFDGIDSLRLAEVYAAAAAAAGVRRMRVGCGPAAAAAAVPPPPLVRLVHRGARPARGGGGDAREMAIVAEDEDAYGMYGIDGLAAEEMATAARAAPLRLQHAWARMTRAEDVAQAWGRSNPAAGGGTAAAAAGTPSYGRWPRGGEYGMGGSDGRTRAVEEDWD